MFSRHKIQSNKEKLETVGVRPGYVISKLLNSRLVPKEGEGHISYVDIVRGSEDTITQREMIKLQNEYKSLKTGLYSKTFQFSSELINQLNHTYIAIELLPEQPWNKYLACLHETTIVQAGLRALTVCICAMQINVIGAKTFNEIIDIQIKEWGVKLDDAYEYSEMGLNLIKLIRYLNSQIQGMDLRMIKHSFSHLSDHEICLLNLFQKQKSVKEYYEMVMELSKVTPEGVKPAVLGLRKLVGDIENNYKACKDKIFNLNRISDYFLDIRMSEHFLAKKELTIMLFSPGYLDKQLGSQLKSLLIEKSKLKWLYIETGDTWRPGALKEIEQEVGIKFPLNEKPVKTKDIVETRDASIRNSMLLLNDLFKYQSASIKEELIKIRNRQVKTQVVAFFEGQRLSKMVNITGGVRSVGSINTLIGYLERLTITTEYVGFSSDDIKIVEVCRNALVSLLEPDESLSIVYIVNKVIPQLDLLVDYLPVQARQELESYRERLRHSSSFSQVWSNALHLKGFLYECFFASDNGLTYVPEAFKKTILEIVSTEFPQKKKEFLDRTLKNPFVRDLRPDFYCTNSTTLFNKGVKISFDSSPVSKEFLSLGPRESVRMKSSIASSRISVPASSYEREDKYEGFLDPEVEQFTSGILPINAVNAIKKGSGTKAGIIDNQGKTTIFNKEETDLERDLNEQVLIASSEGDDIDSENLEELDDEDIDAKLDELKGKKGDTRTKRLISDKQEWDDSLSKKIETENKQQAQLLILEVGYQTSGKEKLVADLSKWELPNQIIRSMGIHVTTMACVDSTYQRNEDWWIKPNSVQLIRNSISELFSLLTQNTPVDISEQIMGQISTQKIRSVIRSGSSIKPPIRESDVMKAGEMIMKRISERPTGVEIPDFFVERMKQSLVKGAYLKNDSNRNGLGEVNRVLESNYDTIIKTVESTPLRVHKLTNLGTQQSFLLGWLSEEMEHCRSKQCVNGDYKRVKDMIDKGFLERLNNQDDFDIIVLRLIRMIGSICVCETCSNLGDRRNLGVETWYHRMLPKGGSWSSEMIIDDRFDSTDSVFDKVVAMPFSGRQSDTRSFRKLLNMYIQDFINYNKIPGVKTKNGTLYVNSEISKNKGFTLSSDDAYIKRQRVRTEEGTEDTQTQLHNDDAEFYKAPKTKNSESCRKELNKLCNLLPEDSRSVLREFIDIKYSEKKSSCRSVITESWIKNILNGLDIKNTNKIVDIPDLIKDVSRRTEYNTDLDNSVFVFTQSEIETSIDILCKDTFEADIKSFELDCMVFEEVRDTMRREYSNTEYEGLLEIVEELIRLLLNYVCFQNLALYSKVCQVFLQCCSELTHSGIKFYKIPHTSLNLIVKVPSKKSSNMKVVIADGEMNIITPLNFLNRRKATLGQSLFYNCVILLVQEIQTYHLMPLHRREFWLNKILLEKAIVENNELIKKVVLLSNSGDLKMAFELLDDFIQKDITLERLIGSTISALSLVYIPVLALNSQGINKTMQNTRYPTMMCLSEFGFPLECGKKLFGSVRRIEVRIYYNAVRALLCYNLKDVQMNQKQWLKNPTDNSSSISSLLQMGLRVGSDRKLLNDIYLVHIYNKELDDFDSGSIRVMKEFAEKHVEWELDLETTIKGLNEAKTGEKERDFIRRLECLTCTPHLKLSEEKLRKRQLAILEKRSMSESSGSSVKHSTKRKKLIVKPDTLENRTHSGSTFTVEDSTVYLLEESGFGRIMAVEPSMRVKYTINSNELTKKVVSCISENKKYSFGSAELIQAAVEHSRGVFNDAVLEKSKQSKRNWATLSTVTETTSVVKEPITEVSIGNMISVVSSERAKKISKLLESNKELKEEIKNKDTKQAAEVLARLMSSSEAVAKDLSLKIIDIVRNKTRLRYLSYSEMMNKSLEQTIFSPDANVFYGWIKTTNRRLKEIIRSKEYILKTFESESAKEVHESLSELGFKYWIEVMISFNEEVKLNFNLSGERVTQTITECEDMIQEVKKVFEDIQNYPDASFQREENRCKQLELKLGHKFSQEVNYAMTILLAVCLTHPRLFHREYYRVVMDQLEELGSPDNSDKEIREVLTKLGLYNGLTFYCATIFLTNEGLCQSSFNNDSTDFLKTIKRALVEISIDWIPNSMKYSVQLIRRSNFEAAKKRIGKDGSKGIPRSIRSKVIYEVYNDLKERYRPILQECAFTDILDPLMRSYSVLAPKAQLGGDRDLLVQELKTKFVNAVSEQFSKSVLDNVSNDGLTNPNLTEQILKTGIVEKKRSRVIHGTKVKSDGRLTKTKKIHFYKVLCIAGDNTKWGPIHTCSFFSMMFQQLLKDNDEWLPYEKMVMLLGIDKQIEIHTASLTKLINGFIDSSEYESYRNNYTKENENELLEQSLLEYSRKWNNIPYMKKLCEWYITKGKVCMEAFNHMGQGIHHATSSLMRNCAFRFIHFHLSNFVNRDYYPLKLICEDAGSSDDFSTVLTFQGTLEESLFMKYESQFEKICSRVLNLMSGLMRCLQMSISAKSVCSSVVNEMYSQFDLGERISPVVNKFVHSSIINGTVTSPSTLAQSTFVTSQQCLYQSVPFLTNLTFTMFRQQVYYNHIEFVIRQFGRVILRLPPSFGGIFIPTIPKLISNGQHLFELQWVHSILTKIQKSLGSTAAIEVNSRFSVLKMEDREAEIVLSNEARELLMIKGLDSEEIQNELSSSSSSPNVEPENERLKMESEEEDIPIRHVLLEEKESESFSDSQSCKHTVPISYIGYCKSEYDKNLSELRGFMFDFKDSEEGAIDLLICKMCLIISSFYQNTNQSPDQLAMKTNYSRRSGQLFGDFFLQKIPLSVLIQLKKLHIYKDEILTTSTGLMETLDPIDWLIMNLVSQTSSTEDPDTELLRMKQALFSRNIVTGLSGGVKEQSIPILRTILRSYYFLNQTPLVMSDHWIKSNDQNRREKDTHLSVNLKTRESSEKVRYTEFLKKCFLSPIVKTIEEPSFSSEMTHTFQPPAEIQELDDLKGNNGLQCIVLSQEKLSKSIRDVVSLIADISDVNLNNLVRYERGVTNSIESSKNIIIDKSKIYTKPGGLRTQNDPTLIFCYSLNPEYLFSLKPVNMQVRSMESEKLILSSNSTKIRKLLTTIKQTALSGEEVTEVGSVILDVCRIIKGSQLKSVSLYLQKTDLVGFESTSENLYKYNLVEGWKVNIKHKDTDAELYSELLYIVLEVISLLTNLPFSKDVKYRLFNLFLQWNPTNCTQLIENDQTCSTARAEDGILGTFADTTIINSLARESTTTRSRRSQEIIKLLMDLINNTTGIGASLAGDSRYRLWKSGDFQSGARLTLTCSEGNSVALVHNSKICLTVSNGGEPLLRVTAVAILQWITGTKKVLLKHSDYVKFVSYLMSAKEMLGLEQGSILRSISAVLMKDRQLKIDTPTEGKPCISIKSGLIVNRDMVNQKGQKSINVEFKFNSMDVFTEVDFAAITLGEEERYIKETLESLELGLGTKFSKQEILMEQKVLIDKIELPLYASRKATILFHCFIHHIVQAETSSAHQKRILLSRKLKEVFSEDKFEQTKKQNLIAIKKETLNDLLMDGTISISNSRLEILKSVTKESVGKLKSALRLKSELEGEEEEPDIIIDPLQELEEKKETEAFLDKLEGLLNNKFINPSSWVSIYRILKFLNLPLDLIEHNLSSDRGFLWNIVRSKIIKSTEGVLDIVRSSSKGQLNKHFSTYLFTNHNMEEFDDLLSYLSKSISNLSVPISVATQLFSFYLLKEVNFLEDEPELGQEGVSMLPMNVLFRQTFPMTGVRDSKSRVILTSEEGGQLVVETLINNSVHEELVKKSKKEILSRAIWILPEIGAKELQNLMEASEAISTPEGVNYSIKLQPFFLSEANIIEIVYQLNSGEFNREQLKETVETIKIILDLLRFPYNFNYRNYPILDKVEVMKEKPKEKKKGKDVETEPIDLMDLLYQDDSSSEDESPTSGSEDDEGDYKSRLIKMKQKPESLGKSEAVKRGKKVEEIKEMKLYRVEPVSSDEEKEESMSSIKRKRESLKRARKILYDRLQTMRTEREKRREKDRLDESIREEITESSESDNSSVPEKDVMQDKESEGDFDSDFGL